MGSRGTFYHHFGEPAGDKPRKMAYRCRLELTRLPGCE
jgi:hypothetical protein